MTFDGEFVCFSQGFGIGGQHIYCCVTLTIVVYHLHCSHK